MIFFVNPYPKGSKENQLNSTILGGGDENIDLKE